MEHVLKRNVTAMTLKYVAAITMLIDHTAIVLVYPHYELYTLYYVMRCIGRLSFPLYLFLLTEGIDHTRSKKRYVISLLAFAVISEIPYDFSLYGGFTWGHQNVFFTLTIGALALSLTEYFIKEVKNKALYGCFDRSSSCGSPCRRSLYAFELYGDGNRSSLRRIYT